MIAIDDKCFIKIDVTNYEDIVDASSKFSLTIKESAGNIMPIATLELQLPVELVDYIAHEGPIVTITIGLSKDSVSISKWRIFNHELNKGTLFVIMSLDRGYLLNPIFRSYQGSSTEVIQSVASQYFDVDIKTSGFSDKMKWCQYGIGSREFVNEVWLHSYDPNKLLLPAIISESNSNKFGTFRLVDVTDKSDATVISTDVTSDDNVLLLSSYKYSSNSGSYNMEIGEPKVCEFNEASPNITPESISVSPIFGTALNQSAVKKSSTETHRRSDNVHDNFFRAKSRNLARLSKFGGFAKRVSVADYKGLKVGDIVNLITPVIGTNAASEIQSGYGCITDTIVRIVSDQVRKSYFKDLIVRKDAVTSQIFDEMIV